MLYEIAPLTAKGCSYKVQSDETTIMLDGYSDEFLSHLLSSSILATEISSSNVKKQKCHSLIHVLYSYITLLWPSYFHASAGCVPSCNHLYSPERIEEGHAKC